MSRLVKLSALVLLTLVLLPTIILAAGGTGPGDALIPTGAPQTIAPHTQVWYRFDYNGDRTMIEVDFAANGAPGVQVLIYTPDQVQRWLQGEPLVEIGRGSPPPPASAQGTYDLVWAGSFNARATYYVVVKNNSDAVVPYQLTVVGDGVTTVPLPTRTPWILPSNPFATPIPVGGALAGKIAFQAATGGDIYAVNGDGSGLRHVAYGIDPAWSPDGTQIAFTRYGTFGGLFLINADGSNEKLLLGGDEIRSPRWSADGTQIAYTQNKVFVAEVVTCPSIYSSPDQCKVTTPEVRHWRIGVVNVADGKRSEPQSTNNAFSPTWVGANPLIAFNDPGIGLLVTPSGAWGQCQNIVPLLVPAVIQNVPILVQQTPVSIPVTVQMTQTLQLNQCAPGGALTISTDNSIRSPVYSPDGKQIAFMVIQYPAWQIAVANADGRNVRLLTRIDPLDFVNPDSVAPTWSPDGKQILFLSNRHGKWEFFAINADGTNLRQVLKNVTDAVTLRYDFMSERVASWSK